jgi:hypothetical protein
MIGRIVGMNSTIEIWKIKIEEKKRKEINKPKSRPFDVSSN